jgi:hypothetical protein
MVPPLLLQAGPETANARTEIQPAPGEYHYLNVFYIVHGPSTVF